jgi:hypothetical protein
VAASDARFIRFIAYSYSCPPQAAFARCGEATLHESHAAGQMSHRLGPNCINQRPCPSSLSRSRCPNSLSTAINSCLCCDCGGELGELYYTVDALLKFEDVHLGTAKDAITCRFNITTLAPELLMNVSPGHDSSAKKVERVFGMSAVHRIYQRSLCSCRKLSQQYNRVRLIALAALANPSLEFATPGKSREATERVRRVRQGYAKSRD